MASQFELPDQFTKPRANRSGAAGALTWTGQFDRSRRSSGDAHAPRRRVTPSEFLTSINEDRDEDEQFTRDNLPEGFSINTQTHRGSRDAPLDKPVETVRYQRGPTARTPSGPPPDVPSPSNPETAAAMDEAEDEQKKRESRKRGRASTILTGGQGLTSPAPLATASLMGS